MLGGNSARPGGRDEAGAGLRASLGDPGASRGPGDDAPQPSGVTMAPVLQQLGDSIFIVWPGERTLEFTRIVEARETVSAELCVVDQGQTLHWARINMMSTQSRNTLAKGLEDTLPGVPWKTIVEDSCRMVVQHLRRGEPSVAVEPRKPREGRYLVNPYIPAGEVTVLYGDGGAGKSLLALSLAVAGLLGHPLTPQWRVGNLERVLYLDWESDAETHGERLHGLTHRRELVQKGAILHRRLWRPLTDTIDVVRMDADKHQADLVICDSLGAACGSEPESADAAVRTMMALRSLRGTKLVIAHVSKTSAELARSRPYGSVYVANLARSLVEARRIEVAEDNLLTIGLYHRKTNVGQFGRATAITFRWDDDESIAVMTGRPDMVSDSVPARILDALLHGHKTAAAMAEELSISPGQVRAALSRLADAQRVVRLDQRGENGGSGREAVWGLRARD